jgi:hypothetical protein
VLDPFGEAVAFLGEGRGGRPPDGDGEAQEDAGDGRVDAALVDQHPRGHGGDG